MMENKRRKVYDILVDQTGYKDSYEDFDKFMNDPSKRKKVYDALTTQTGYKDNYEDFDKFMGQSQSTQPTQQTAPSAPSAPRANNEQPQNVTPSASNVSVTPATNTTQPTTTTNVADANVTEGATQKTETAQVNDATTSQNADGGSTERAMAKDSQGRYREVLGVTESDNGWKYRSSDKVKREYDLGVGDNTVESQIVQWAEKAPSTEDPNEPLYLTSLLNRDFNNESIEFLKKHNPELYKNFSNKQKWKAEDKNTSEYVGAMVDANLDYFKQFFPEGWSDDHIKAYIYDTQIFGKTDNYLLKYVKDNDYHAVGKYITSGILGVKRRFGENTHRYFMTHDNEQSDFLLNVALWAEKEYGFVKKTNIPEEFKQMLMRTLDEVTKADEDGVTLMDKYDEVEDEDGNKIKVSRGEIFVNKALAKLNTYADILENIPNEEERIKYLGKNWRGEVFTDPWDPQQGLDEVAKANGYRLAQINIANNPEKLNSASEHLEELRKKANDAYGNSDKLEFALNATLDGYVPGTPNAYDLYLMEKGYYNPIEQTKLAIRLREEAQDMAEDAKSDGSLSRFWEGLKAGATDADLWTGGLSSVADGFLIRDVMEKYNADKENLTKEEEMLLDAFFTKLSVEAYTDRGIAYDVGRSIPESIGFMLSFLLSPTSGLAGGLTRKFAKWAIKKYGKGVIRANATKFALGKGLAYGVGSAANAGATSFTTGAGFTAKNISDELAKSYDPNEDKFVGDKKPLTAIAKGLYKTFNEVFVEEAGGSLLKSIFKPIDWGLGKISPTYNQSKELWEGFASGKGFKQFKAKTGFNGTPIEFGEEILTDIANLPISNDTFDADEQTGIFGTRRMVTTGLSCLAIGTMMNTPNAVTYQSESKRIAKYRENTNNLGSLVLGKKWEGIKSRIDNATPSEIEGVVMQEMMKGKLTTSQKKAILKYAGARVQQDALLLRENELAMEAKASKVIDAQGTLNDKTKEGYNATDENEQRRMEILAQQSEQEVKAMLGENEPEAMSALNTRYGVTTAEDLVAKVVNDESLTPEQRNAILNYINTDASKHAIEKRMADDANALIMQAKREIDSYANEDAVQARNPNNVIEAKLKEDDSQVYVISGNVELLEDGTVSTKGSSESIVVFNPNAEDPTKQKVMTTPAQLYDVTKGNAQAMLDERVSQIKAEHQRKLTQVTTGERTFEINQQITIPTQDGQGVQTATITNITPGKNGSPLITYTSDVDGTTSQVTIPKAEVEQKMDEVLLIGNTPSVNEAPSAITAEPQISVPQAPVAEVEETKPIEVEDNVTFEVDGNQLQGVVASIEEGDGVAIVQTEDEKVHRVPLDNLTIVEETATKEQGGNNVEPTANATSEGSSQEILDNSNEVEQNVPIAPTESTPQAETPSESTSQDANDSKLPPLMGIPTDENGNKMYESASVEATINDIYNDPELDEEEADAYVQARIDGATKRVAELEKKKPKMGEDRDAYVAQRDTWRAEREAEQAKLDYWQGVQEARKNSTSSAESAEATPIEPSEESVAPIVEGVEDTQEESSDNQEEKLNTKEENIEEEEANIPMANESSMPIESTEEVEEIEISKATPQAKQSIKSKPGVVKNSQSLRLPKGQVKLLDRVAKALGVQIEFVPTMQGANAKIVGNKVTVALDAEQIQRFGADGVTIVIGHELTHRIKALSNEAFEDFAHIIESILPEQFKQRMIYTRIAYSRQGLNIGKEALREEVVADLAGLIMTDGNLMEEFLKELEPKSTKQQILDILKQMFNALKGVFQGKTARDLANAERVLLESMKKASAVVNEDNTTEANNASEKLSIIGESGASALDRAEEATQRMDNLESARKMEKYDYPKKAIRMATGWERGADGKWRYEIEDDFVFDIDGNVDYGKRNPQRLNDYKRYKELLHKKNALAFDGEELNAEEKAEFDDLAVIWKGTKLHNSTRLKDYIDHPELFEAYPELRDVSISFDNINARGEYDSSANEITLSNTLSPNEAKSTLIHEIQHAIQKIEGFARGGNVEASKNLIRERNNKALIWSFRKNISHMAKDNPGLSPLELIDKVLARRVELTGDNIATLEEQGAIPNEDGRIKAYNLWARGYDNEGYENAYNMVLGDDAFEVYRRHAGEVESRNVQSRMGMTPDQRRATLLAETEDVARKDQIFLMENSGVSAMGSTVVKRKADIAVKLQGKDISPTQLKVVNAFTTDVNNIAIDVVDANGKQRNITLKQGQDNRAGVKHSVLKHYETASNSYSAEDILLIPQIIEQGERKQDGKKVSYKLGINGVTYSVTTEINNRGAEVFTNFYTNRSGNARSSNTQLSAQADSTTTSADKGSDNIGDVQEDAKYSLRSNSQEVADIVAKAKADGTYMKAPNGEPTNLTEEQWANVRTKAFKDWFGDWENDSENASKVVDENGEPMVVYHGTESDFNVFDRTKGRASMDIQGMFFSPWELDAQGYGRNVRAFYLNIRKPSSGGQSYKALNRYQGQMYAGVKARDYLIGLGYDGVDNYGEEFIAFEPNQIKSATDNVGTYSSEDNDTRYSLRSDVGSTESALDAMKDDNSKGWESIKDKLRGTPIWNEVAKDANYTDDDAITKEALSRLKVGIDDLTQEMTDNAKGVFEKAEAVAMADRMRRALNEFDAWVEQQVAEPTEGEDVVKYSLVSDPKLIAELDASPKRIGYRNVVMNEDGTFGSPMASGLRNKGKGKVKTSSFAMGEWEQAEENPDLANENGKINLVKPDGKSVDQVDYNPYIHNRIDKVNAQFKQAWERPNLVYVETEIPLTDLESGYHAEKAKLPVGVHSWSNGDLILSRYDKPVRIVPWEEVADDWVERFGDRGVEFDIVPPALLPILVERGVEILPPHKGMGKNCVEAYEGWKAEQEGEEGVKYSLRDNQGNPIDENGRLIVEEVSSIDEITDADFDSPTRSIQLPSIPPKVDEAIGANGKPIVIKKNVFEKNKKSHKDLTPKDSRAILLNTLYSPDLYGQNQKITRPYNWILIHLADTNTAVLVEVNENKDNVEIVNWHYINDDAIERKKKQAIREGGLILTLESAAADTSNFLPSADKVNNNLGENQEDDTKYSLRSGDGLSNPDKVIAREAYERMVASGRYQFTEAMQDSMMGLKLLYKAILGKKMQVENIPDFENAYIAENLMSSQNAAMQQEYYIKFMKPLVKAIHSLGGKDKAKRQAIIDYMMAKHGLERNQVMAHRDAKALADEAVYGIQFNTESEKQDTWQKAYDKAYKENREVDYAGLTALTGTDKVAEAEAKATEMVEQFETDNNKDNAVTELWARVNDATKANLERLRKGGVISTQQYRDTLEMYEYYIPLRGWDATTSDEVYAYLTSKNSGMMGSTMKGAKGRKSKADDPIATIGAMADSAIREANRNAMKQRFLNFVLNHPSDLVSVGSIWLQYDDVTNTWIPVFADIKAEDTPDVIEQKLQEFNEKMQQLRNENPGKYKHDREAQNIPYVVKPGMDKEHQVMVKRNGQTYILTINSNPRAAQALNGLTNPDVDVEGWIGKLLNGAEKVNRQLSAFYTTRNPDFVVSNFSRDMIYSNAMAWVKESPKYAVNFHANCGVAFTMLPKLLIKWERGTLDMNNSLEEMFYQFMINGGETGYTEIRDVEKHKRMIASELKKHKNVVKNTWHGFGAVFDGINRQIENTARFAAFKTSREMGRTVQRSAYDAKEISVNFNKKGSGAKMLGATGQTFWGDFGAWNSGLGRTWWVFWNAGVQGMTNFGKNVKRHPVKATALMSLAFVLGACAPTWNDDDDDDKKKYYLIPEYIRRSNICFRVWGDTWCTIPLPIELRAMYGLGELYTAVTSGGEKLSNEELAYAIAGQVSQVLPLDMLEGGGGLNALIPTAIKPIVEAYRNIGWHGGPIHREFYTSDMADTTPQWTLAYPSVSSFLMNFTKALNEWSGGENYEGVEGAKPNDAIKGEIDLNPAKIEYVLKGYFGGVYTTFNNIIKSTETVFGDRKFEAKNTPVYNRLFKEDDPEAEKRKYNKIFYKDKESDAIMEKRIKNTTKFSKGNLEYADKLAQLQKSDEYKSYVYRKGYKEAVKLIQKRLNYGDELINEEDLNARIDALKKEMAEGMESADNKSVKKLEIESAKRALKIDKDFKDVDAKQNEIKGKKRAEELKEQGASATKIKRSKGYYEGYKKRQTKEFDEREAEIRRMENEPEDLFDEDDYEEQGD